MNWTTGAVTTAMAILLIAAFAFVVVNRASEKIVTAAVPLALGATLAIGLVVFFTREEPQTRTFPVKLIYQHADKLPISIPGRPFPWLTLGFVDELRQQRPEELEDRSERQLLYHEFLQKSLVDWVAEHHFGTWRMELLRFRSGDETFQPIPGEPQEASKILKPEEVQEAFGKNRFAPFYSGFGRLALPPGTTLTIDVPKTPEATGLIHLKNWFCEITMTTSLSHGMRGVHAYALILGIPFGTSVDNEFWSQQFIVRLKTTFSPFLVGHPKMAAHRRWATNILDGLQDAFDEQRIWDRTVENFTLQQHIAPAARPPIPFGPVRAPQRTLVRPPSTTPTAPSK